MSSIGSNSVSRRSMLRGAAVAAATASAFPRFITGAEADKPIRVGLVGCGNRGTKAAENAMDAAPNVKIVALADAFPDRLAKCRKTLQKASPVDDKNCFVGLDAYRKLLEVELDYVILATPPGFRPEHLEACVKAGRHVFMEKPVAVDPVGVRRVLAAGEEADRKNLCLVAGTQRRHQNSYIETIKRLKEGAIGKILSAQCYWNGKPVWHKDREAGWSDAEWVLRDWNNWNHLSGDHVVEQHVHNLDVINWALGAHPLAVVAMGGRHRRLTGNQYDFFCADLFYPIDGDDKEGRLHVLSQCRQIAGCESEISERVIGEKGVSNCNGWISTIRGEIPFKKNTPTVQEHADLIAAIRTGSRLNEARNVAESTLVAIMIRTSAYTGKKVTWDEMMKSDLVLSPPDYELTPVNIRAHIPVPGQA